MILSSYEESFILARFLMKPEISRHIFGKFSLPDLHKNLSSGSRVISRQQLDRHDEADSRLNLKRY